MIIQRTRFDNVSLIIASESFFWGGGWLEARFGCLENDGPIDEKETVFLIPNCLMYHLHYVNTLNLRNYKNPQDPPLASLCLRPRHMHIYSRITSFDVVNTFVVSVCLGKVNMY